MTFKSGDKVVCISRSGKWYDSNDYWKEVDGPKFGEELVVDLLEDGHFLVFLKYSKDGYDPNQFRKVQPRDEGFVKGIIDYIMGKKKRNSFQLNHH